MHVSNFHKCKNFFCRVIVFPDVFFSRMANLASGMNDIHATRLVCSPAEKNGWGKLHDKNILFTFLKTRDMYLHFTRSYIWANGNK